MENKKVLSKKVIICNKLGLHARAAAKLVHFASRFGSEIHLIKKNYTVNAKSIMGVMMLAASKGTELEITAEGEDQTEALDGLEKLINERFGEEE
jgi:phosphocarrier protein HPr